MSITEYHFQYNDLSIDLQNLQTILGYPGEPLPAPFDGYLEEALAFASKVADIQAVCRLVEPIELEPSKGRIVADGQVFNIGKTLCKELKYAEKLLFFICTAGKTISDRSSELLTGEDPVQGYVLDQVGIFLTEAAGNRMQELVREDLSPEYRLTNRYSPGYCHWEMSDQLKLFSLFPPAPCGVTLTTSLLMNPVKSISGVIGVGQSVGYRDYPCALCLSEHCIYRKTAS